MVELQLPFSRSAVRRRFHFAILTDVRNGVPNSCPDYFCPQARCPAPSQLVQGTRTCYFSMRFLLFIDNHFFLLHSSVQQRSKCRG